MPNVLGNGLADYWNAMSYSIDCAEEYHLGKVKIPDDALTAARKAEADRMAGVFALLYTFENSVREFVDGHLTAALGLDWYGDPKVVSNEIRKTVERNKAAEGRNRYHSRRGARPIYYTNNDDLGTITHHDHP